MGRSSASEDERMARAERMVRNAIDAHAAFDGYRSVIKVYAKGSYANQTNVRADSDVDIVVENRDLYYYRYNPHSSAPAPDPNASPYTGRWDSKDEWRAEVTKAMMSAFGQSQVDTSGKVALTISEVPGSRPSADVIPSFEFRRFDSPDRRTTHVGSRVFATDGDAIDNYPAQQKRNGIEKDQLTSGRYRKYVRALKSAENYLVECGTISDLPSYFMECLVWNVPNSIIKTGYSLDDGFRASLSYLLTNLLPDHFDKDQWTEPNGLKWLFPSGAKWSRDDGLLLCWRTWEHLGYSA